MIFFISFYLWLFFVWLSFKLLRFCCLDWIYSIKNLVYWKIKKIQNLLNKFTQKENILWKIITLEFEVGSWNRLPTIIFEVLTNLNLLPVNLLCIQVMVSDRCSYLLLCPKYKPLNRHLPNIYARKIVEPMRLHSHCPCGFSILALELKVFYIK